jgi:hypothetical protein
MTIYSSTAHNGQKMETIQMSINQCTDKQNSIYPYNRILLRYKKEWSVIHATTYMQWKHYSK